MRIAKKYDSNKLKDIVNTSISFREVGRKLSVDSKTAKHAIDRYNIPYPHFRHGKIYEALIGKEFGQLTVLGIYRKKRLNKRTVYRAKCLCNCGNSHDADAASVKAGRCSRCSNCIKKDKTRYDKITGRNNKNFKGHEDIRGNFWSKLKKKTLKRKIPFKVDIKYVWDLFVQQDKKCALSNIPIKFGRSSYRTETTASLDRIDSSKGYIKGNVQWVHKSINIMKNDLTEDIFIGICDKISDKFKDMVKPDMQSLSVNHFVKRGDKKCKHNLPE